MRTIIFYICHSGAVLLHTVYVFHLIIKAAQNIIEIKTLLQTCKNLFVAGRSEPSRDED
jgi:hypothetical protein